MRAMPISACCRKSRTSRRCAVRSNRTRRRSNATESGYEAGTRTAVDVLESRRPWIQAQTDYSRSRYDYMINVVKLQQAAGILSEQSLNRLNALLKDELAAGGAARRDAPPKRLSRRSGLDELEQPRDAAAVRFDELPRACARLARRIAGIGEESPQRRRRAPRASATSTAPPASSSSRAISLLVGCDRVR